MNDKTASSSQAITGKGGNKDTISNSRIFICAFLTYKIAFLLKLILPFVAAKVNIKEAELLHQAGALKEPVIQKSEGGWVVTLEGNHKLNPKLETARGQVRVFKRLDAAVGVLFGVGFKCVKVTQ